MTSPWLQHRTIDWAAAEQTDWAQAMRACPQDPLWHAEGDVWTHTHMVVQALERETVFQAMTPDEQLVLRLAALLHDVGKPATTRSENGRIVSPHHAAVGEKIARELLWDFDLPRREQVCALVRLHGLPLWALEKTNPNRAVVAASLRVRNDWTALLARADVIGRIAPDQGELLERIGYFTLLCEELGCLYAPFVFFNDHSRFRFFQTDTPYPADLYDDTTFVVTLLSGLPGSGKDTCAATLGQPVVSLDQLRQQLRVAFDDRNGQGRVAQAAYAQAKNYGLHKQPFVWNSTNLTLEMRGRLIRTLSPYRPHFRLIYLETDWEQLLQRRRQTIPVQKLIELRRKMDFPQLQEVHGTEYRRT